MELSPHLNRLGIQLYRTIVSPFISNKYKPSRQKKTSLKYVYTDKSKALYVLYTNYRDLG